MIARRLALIVALAALASCSSEGVPENAISGLDQLGSLVNTMSSCTDDRFDDDEAMCTRYYYVDSEAGVETVAEFVRDNGFEVIETVDDVRVVNGNTTRALDTERDDRCLSADVFPGQPLVILVRQPYQEGGTNPCRWWRADLVDEPLMRYQPP